MLLQCLDPLGLNAHQVLGCGRGLSIFNHFRVVLNLLHLYLWAVRVRRVSHGGFFGSPALIEVESLLKLELIGALGLVDH